MTDVPLRCACGKLSGTASSVSAKNGTHLVCHCVDCQAFAAFLGREGVVDDHGGTAIYQMAPGRVKLDGDTSTLRCVRLSSKGMHRFYCDACKTPVANTMTAKEPFVGLHVAFVDPDHPEGRAASVLGEPTHWRIASSPKPPPPELRDGSELRFFARTARLMLGWWLRKLAKPSPFFYPHTGNPRASVRVLAPEERRALDRP